MSGLGLPANLPAGVIPEAEPDDRDWVEYTLPMKSVKKKFFPRFTEADLTFRVTELDPMSMEAAVKRAGGTQNSIRVGQEMTFLAIMKVGSWETKGRHADLKAWWDAIGFKGRSMVQQAMEALHNVEDDEVEMFLASAKPKQG